MERNGIAPQSTNDRRNFIKGLAGVGTAAALGRYVSAAPVPQASAVQVAQPAISPKWAKQMGIQFGALNAISTLNDPKVYEATLLKIAQIGYKEIEPWGGYCNMSPQEFLAMLKRCGVTMPSTHSDATPGPDFEQQLAGFQVMGIKYVEVGTGGAGRGAGGRGPGGPPGGGPGGVPAGGRGPGGPGGPGRGPGRGPGGMPQTADSVKKMATQFNEWGKVAKKFDQQILVHNHTMEFAPLADNPNQRPYDIFLAETDPELVVMQLDIGWATIAGQDVLGMFKKNPGRFVLWHVKDAVGIKLMTPQMSMGDRANAAYLVPVGQGEVDYKPVFAQAELAGLKHFYVEQDNVAAWGDAFSASKVAYDNLMRVLS